MTRSQICKCLKACSRRDCSECMLANSNDCVNLLIKKAFAVVCFDTKLIKDLLKESEKDVI